MTVYTVSTKQTNKNKTLQKGGTFPLGLMPVKCFTVTINISPAFINKAMNFKYLLNKGATIDCNDCFSI